MAEDQSSARTIRRLHRELQEMKKECCLQHETEQRLQQKYENVQQKYENILEVLHQREDGR